MQISCTCQPKFHVRDNKVLTYLFKIYLLIFRYTYLDILTYLDDSFQLYHIA